MKNSKIASLCLTSGILIGSVCYPIVERSQQVSQTHMESSRASQWPKIAAAHLKLNPKCACCGGTKNRQVHHIQPFSENPELELDPKNLITLCTDGPCNLNCHFVIGHLGNTKCSNPNVREDAEYLRQRFLSRKCD